MTDSAHRTRLISALFAGVELSAAGCIALVTVTPLAAEDLLGDARWSGLPSALDHRGDRLGNELAGSGDGAPWTPPRPNPRIFHGSDRVGRKPVIVIAGFFLIASGLVSASALLTEAVPYDDRMRLQGFADSVVWTSAATAGVSSGLLLHSIGYAALCSLGALVAILPAAWVALRRA